jgi:hypothetical protein
MVQVATAIGGGVVVLQVPMKTPAELLTDEKG